MRQELKRQSASPFAFASERGGPFTPSGFAELLARAGDEANIGFKVHPHMLKLSLMTPTRAYSGQNLQLERKRSESLGLVWPDRKAIRPREA